jgi:hypothetical protein
MAALAREIRRLRRQLEGTPDEAERSTIQKKIEVNELLLLSFIKDYKEMPIVENT